MGAAEWAGLPVCADLGHLSRLWPRRLHKCIPCQSHLRPCHPLQWPVSVGKLSRCWVFCNLESDRLQLPRRLLARRLQNVPSALYWYHLSNRYGSPLERFGQYEDNNRVEKHLSGQQSWTIHRPWITQERIRLKVKTAGILCALSWCLYTDKVIWYRCRVDKAAFRRVLPLRRHWKGERTASKLLVRPWNYINWIKLAWIRQLHPCTTLCPGQCNHARGRLARSQRTWECWEMEDLRRDRRFPLSLYQKIRWRALIARKNRVGTSSCSWRWWRDHFRAPKTLRHLSNRKVVRHSSI